MTISVFLTQAVEENYDNKESKQESSLIHSPSHMPLALGTSTNSKR